MNTVLHVPLNKELKSNAEEVAKKQGYSSLQEVIRIFITLFANGEIKTTFISEEKHLDRRLRETRAAIEEAKAFRFTNK